MKCKHCAKILKTEGIKGMQKRNFKSSCSSIKTNVIYPFGKKSKPRTTVLYCRNCKGIKFE